MDRPEPTTISYYDYGSFDYYMGRKYPKIHWLGFWANIGEIYRRGELVHLNVEDLKIDEEFGVAEAIATEFGNEVIVLFDW